MIIGLDATRAPPPPSITVHPPSTPFVPEVPQPAYQPPPNAVFSAYQPPSEIPSPPRSASQPPSSNRKVVQFADNVEEAEAQPPQAPEGPVPTSAPDQQNRHRRHRSGETSRGYDAGDDTDSTPDEYRRRHQGQNGLDPTPEGPLGDGKRRHHRRRKSHDPSSSSATASSSRPQPLPPQPQPDVDRNATLSPASDDTVDLPERFDKQGRRKLVPGEDPLADKLEDILAGKGLGRRLFGNFADGLLGGSRGGPASGNGDGNNRRRR